MVDKMVKRLPVGFDYTALNWEFVKKMARIPIYASKKYGSWSQYKVAVLRGDKSPINHAIEHLRSYLMGEPYDHFDGHRTWHLVAAAYNCMMSYYYDAQFGHDKHPLTVEKESSR